MSLFKRLSVVGAVAGLALGSVALGQDKKDDKGSKPEKPEGAKESTRSEPSRSHSGGERPAAGFGGLTGERNGGGEAWSNGRRIAMPGDGAFRKAVAHWTTANSRFGSGFFDRPTNTIVHRVISRSGEPAYGTNHNSQNLKVGPPPQTPPPLHGPKVENPIWRTGYTAPAKEFMDDLFNFAYYSFNYSVRSADMASPFYAYSNLPPYVQKIRTDPPPAVVVSQAAVQPDAVAEKAALDDLKQAWVSRDPAVIARLLPTSGDVWVKVGDQSYGLLANDFFDLFHDGVDNTQTLSFGVISCVSRADGLHVEARHDFRDAWATIRSITQSYVLVREAGAYVIRSFESEPYKAP